MPSLNYRGAEMVAIVTVLVGVSFIAVLLRIFARFKRQVRFGVDDYLCFISMVLLFAMLIELGLWCTIGGDGKHQADLDMTTMLNFGKIFLANQFTYFLLCPAIKTSIVCFYRRVFTTQKFQHLTFALNTLIVTWAAGIVIACGLQCRPIESFWDPRVEGKCFDQNKFLVVNQIFNVVIDFVILALPVPMIWNLQRAWQDKLALNGVFALGIFVCFASIYRIVVLFWINPADTTYTVYEATLWTHIEPSIGLICSCLPIIRGLFPKLRFPGGSSRQKYGYGTAPYYLSTSASHFATSTGPRSPGIDYYIKMEEGILSRPETRKEGEAIAYPTDSKLDLSSAGGIAVRTEIDVTQDAASAKSIR
ncbi:uncharacterized protein ACHE_31231A [Aspergillus chevalieri]|uniref:Rhodopsin domain-containing protein n=1 Tax=Aspergillus chevalieri TaxID=182096 RepID=A0A7R7ZN29_ASPCH|nr:uncharacterized protein ACHE_31231A [Aspergillus chevalieri]BCR87244.1 hypothetical protein ACHE_31231A [Aspergillus chevalieri]